MALEIAPALEAAFQEADRPDGRLDVHGFRAKLVPIMTAVTADTPEVRKGNFALVGALDFQPRHTYGEPVWEMHWQPLSSSVDIAGNVHHSPEARVLDSEIISHWRERARAARHPVLRARYADLAWEFSRFRHELKVRPDVTCARTAIDGYLDSVERCVTADDFDAWNDLARAVELAVTINDAPRLQRAKQLLFDFRADCEARDLCYAFWQFDEIAWSQSRALNLNDADRAMIVEALDRKLASRSKVEDPKLFDPHVARDAADRLGRWRDLAG
jgi:lysyl-tRNA synthetase class 1